MDRTQTPLVKPPGEPTRAGDDRAAPEGHDDPQEEVVAYLGSSDCPAYRTTPTDGEEPRAPTTIETHSARLFVGERIVCKIKRAVAYSYLDMTALGTRRRLCERELEINRPGLPDVYIDVVAITREADGTLAVNGAGAPLEWVLRMHRFEQRFVLDEMADSGDLTPAIARRLGASIARYHAPLPPDRDGDGHTRAREVVDELDAELALLDACLPRADSARFAERARSALDTHRALLDRRAREGFVRRCHGDLHLRNLLLHGGEPVPFDALEFDERMATTDVLYDLAFLIMDLGHRDLPRQQNLVLNAYLLHSEPDNAQGLALLPVFLAMRAAVRAMTTAQAAVHDSAHGTALDEEAMRYLAAALDALAPRRPLLVTIGGLSGSGKSTAAVALSDRIARAPGAVLLGSDAERKVALGVNPTERLDPSRYTPSAARANYEALGAKAGHALAAGFTVVLDATWLDAAERTAVAALARAADVPFVGLWLDAPPAVLRERVARRRGGVSDATVAVLDGQLARRPQVPDGWHRIDAAGDPADTLHRCIEPIVRARGGG